METNQETNQLQVFNFHGDEILYIKDNYGKEFFPLKKISENINIRWDAELLRIKGDPVLNEGIQNFSIPTNGGLQEMACLNLEMLNGYIFGIPITERTRPEVREKLILYKKECYKVLYDYFRGKQNIGDPLLMLCEAVKQVRESQLEFEKQNKEIKSELQIVKDDIQTIKKDRQDANDLLQELPLSMDKPKELTLRAMINQVVRAIAWRSKNFKEVWDKAYRELKYRYQFDAIKRATNKGTHPLDEVENQNLLKELYDIVSEMARQAKVEVK